MALPMANTGEESTGTWLPIIEYSIKSGVSLSTIRRRIKSNSIPYRLENGKYLIFLQEGEASSPDIRAVPQAFSNVAALKPTQPSSVPRYTPVPTAPKTIPPNKEALVSDNAEPAAVRMLSDAYEHALREKEERILLLERQVRDQATRLEELKLLVDLLEEKYEVRY